MISLGTLKTLAQILRACKHTWQTQQGMKGIESIM